MNLFQTSSVVDQFLNYKYQSKLKEQQGVIDTAIAESKNVTAVETTSMETESAEKRNTETNLFRLGEKVIDRAPEIIGIGIGGYAIGKSKNDNSNKPSGKGGNSGSSVSNSQGMSKYDEISNQLDKMLGNSKIETLQESLRQITNIDANKFLPSTSVIKDKDQFRIINNNAFSTPDIIPIVTTGLGAIGMSLSSLAFM